MILRKKIEKVEITPVLKREWTGKVGAEPEVVPEVQRDIISERYLPREEKERIENRIIQEYSGEQVLYEHKWTKMSEEELSEIERRVDVLSGRIPEVREEPKPRYAKPRYEYIPVEVPYTAPSWIELPITGTILDKRILYKTSGGYVIEIVYRAPDGALKTERFSVTSVGDVEAAIDKLRPSVEAYIPHIPAEVKPPPPPPPAPPEIIPPQPEVKEIAPQPEAPPAPAPPAPVAAEEVKTEKKGFKLPIPRLPAFGKKEETEKAAPEVKEEVKEEVAKEEEKKSFIGGVLGRIPFMKKK